MSKDIFMLCGSVREEELNLLDKNKFLANIKFDGERVMLIKKGTDIFLINRRGRNKNLQYPEIVEEIKQSKDNFILDGEVITTDGLFNSFQHRCNLSDRFKIEQAKKDYPIKFMVFDMLELNEENLRNKHLFERVKILYSVIGEKFNFLEFAEYKSINEMLFEAKLKQNEGIVIKDMNSVYEERRSDKWLKCKLWNEEVLRVIQFIDNPAGIRVEDKDKNAIQVAGYHSTMVKNKIVENGYCDIIVQFLSKTSKNKMRFPSFREVKK